MAKFIAIDEVAIKNMRSWNKENPPAAGAVPLIWPSLNPLLPVMVLFPGMIRQYHNQMMFILEKRSVHSSPEKKEMWRSAWKVFCPSGKEIWNRNCSK